MKNLNLCGSVCFLFLYLCPWVIVAQAEILSDSSENLDNSTEISVLQDLQIQINDLKMFRLQDKRKIENLEKRVKNAAPRVLGVEEKIQVQNIIASFLETSRLEDKTEIQNLKTVIKSLHKKLLLVGKELQTNDSNIELLIDPAEKSQIEGPGQNEAGKISASKLEVETPETTAKIDEKGETEILGEKSTNSNQTFETLARLVQDNNFTTTPEPEPEPRPKSCSEIVEVSTSQSKQKVYPNGRDESRVEVLCDFITEGGNWTTIQKRSSGPKEEFYRDWTDHEEGFGSLDGNFWIGLKTIHALTKGGDQELRIDLWDFESEQRYAKYSNFSIADSSDFYRLTIGGYSGTAGNSMDNNNGWRFTTKDKDNDKGLNFNCATNRAGAWWYPDCGWSNLNGLYYGKGEKASPTYSGILWESWKGAHYSLRKVEMKIRTRR